MKKVVKLYTVSIEGRYIREFVEGSMEFELFKRLSSEEARGSEWLYEHYKPKGVTEEAWKALVEPSAEDMEGKTEEEVKELKKRLALDRMAKYPRCEAFDADLDESEFMRLSLERVGSDVRIKKAREVVVSVDTSTAIETAMDMMSQQMDHLVKLQDKCLSQLQKASELAFNAKCGSPVANEFLSSINSTMLLEDSCTDVLQDALNKGWRILNVTPQPDQRRADYVLGRYDPNAKQLDNDYGAYRSHDLERNRI